MDCYEIFGTVIHFYRELVRRKLELPSTHGIKQYVKTFVLKDLAAVEREKSYSELASNNLIEASSQTDTKLFGEPFLCLFPPYLQCRQEGARGNVPT